MAQSLPVSITVMDFDTDHLEERTLASIADCLPYRDKTTLTWINICGLRDPEDLAVLGKHFGIKPLTLEDIADTRQRPKMVDEGKYFFVIARMLDAPDRLPVKVSAEQLSLVVGPGFLISFQERPGDILDPLRDRIRKGTSRTRALGSDYLLYALLDTLVDRYFQILEMAGEKVELLEDELLAQPTTKHLNLIHRYRRSMIILRRAVWPLREVLNQLERGENDLIAPGTIPFLHNLYGHIIQGTEEVETYRDMLSGLQDLYLSGISNRMNEVMKVLTVAATIFVPLTFLTGVYGMNFRHIPELDWKWSYHLFWGVSVVLTVGMIIFFRRKKYL